VKTAVVTDLFTIGEFSTATHLSVKALRHYHDVGLLEPVAIDPATGYRSYSVAQVPAAQIIKRLRDLEMPLDQIGVVLDAAAAGDTDERDRVILVHLEQMEQRLEQTQTSVASLRGLLEGRPSELAVEHRTLPAMPVLAMRGVVTWDEAEAWLTDAFAGIHDALDRAGVAPAGPDGALYPSEFFEAHAGEVVAFVPGVVAAATPLPDAIEARELPPVAVAVAVHEGACAELDRTYAALGAHVATRAIGARGSLREHYLDDTHTEVAWPVTPAAADRSGVCADPGLA
jgi:DNA-binding transcriptional MerR regulator